MKDFEQEGRDFGGLIARSLIVIYLVRVIYQMTGILKNLTVNNFVVSQSLYFNFFCNNTSSFLY